jgi:hypothetical protein
MPSNVALQPPVKGETVMKRFENGTVIITGGARGMERR